MMLVLVLRVWIEPLDELICSELDEASLISAKGGIGTSAVPSGRFVAEYMSFRSNEYSGQTSISL